MESEQVSGFLWILPVSNSVRDVSCKNARSANYTTDQHYVNTEWTMIQNWGVYVNRAFLELYLCNYCNYM